MGMEIITPERAKELLARNADFQRKRNYHRVDLYAADMESGAWVYNGDAIRIDNAGRLIDGQHRLAAIVKSGTSQPMNVVTGLDPACFATIDRGQGRTTAQATGIKPSNIAAAKVLLIYEQTGSFASAAMSTTACPMSTMAQADTYNSAAAWCDSIVRAKEWLKVPLKRLSVIPFAAAAAALAAKGEPVDSTFKFFRELANAYTTESTQLARTFVRLYEPGTGVAYRKAAAALVLRAHDCWKTGMTLKRKQVGEDFFVAYDTIPGPITAIREMH